MVNDTLFHEYFKTWIKDYKEGNVREVTLRKYNSSLTSLVKYAPRLKISELNRKTYQDIINKYGAEHEIITTTDFHHHLRACLSDMVEDGILEKNPSNKATMKGTEKKERTDKFISQFETQCLVKSLKINGDVNMDLLIFLIIKTGMRFSEAIAITPKDIDISNQTINVDKTWDYKNHKGFAPTKNKSSIRKIPVDWKTLQYLSEVIKSIPKEQPLFLLNKKEIYNSTANEFLKRKCLESNIPIITIHGLRHTHASLLLASGVSVASVAKRLGHSNMATTQKVYLHIIRELENKDNALALATIMNLET